MATKQIYQFRAELREYSPKIWRTFQVADSISMAKLGYIIITMFEMHASHSFCFDLPFEKNFRAHMLKAVSKEELGKFMAKTDILDVKKKNWHIEIIDDEFYDPYDNIDDDQLFDAVKTAVKEIVSINNNYMVFSYDFGDGWEIDITLEDIIEKDIPAKELPLLLDGKGFGIIEDCGGCGGLEEIAKAYKLKSGEEYDKYCEWLGLLMTLISDLKNFHEFSVTLMSMVLNLQKSRWIY